MPTSYAGTDVYPASYNIPSDGDFSDASSVNVALEALGDRTAYLKQRIASRYSYVFDSGSGTGFAAPDTLADYRVWTELVFTEPATGGFVDVPGCLVGDILWCRCTSVASYAGPVAHGDGWRLRVRDAGGLDTFVPGARILLPSGLAGARIPVSMAGTHTVAAAGTTRVVIVGKRTASGASDVTLQGVLSIHVAHSRG